MRNGKTDTVMASLGWVILLLAWPANCLQRETMQFLQAALSQSTTVVLTCWQKRQSVELVKALSQSGLMMSVQDCAGDLPVPDPVQPVTFLLDLHSSYAARLMRQADDFNLFSSPHHWLMIMSSVGVTDSNDIEHVTSGANTQEDCCSLEFPRSMFSSLNIFVDSQVTIACQLDNGSFCLVEVYRMGLGQSAVFRTTGSWHSQTGLHTTQLTVPARRINLHRTQLRTSMVVTDNGTLSHLTDLHNTQVDTVTKLNYILLLHVVDYLNASIEFSIVDTWGYPTNGSWSGMVGYLQRKEADIGATALFFTANRLPVIQYIALTTPTRISFLFRQPPLSFVTNVFTLPFSRGVWLSAAGLVGICTVALYIALSHEVGQSSSRTSIGWSDVVLLSLGAACQQGYPVAMKGTSERIVAIFLFVAVLFLYTSYAGCIVALLQSSTDSIRTLEDLLNSRLEVGAHDIVYNRYYFEKASEPVRKGLSKRVFSMGSRKPNFLELTEGVEKVRHGFFALHVEESNGYKCVKETFTEEEKCGLQSISGYIQPNTFAWIAVPRGTPYTELFKRGYLKVQEHGLQSRELSRLYTRKPECTGHSSSFVSVGLVDWYPALLVLLGGMVLSFIMLLLEKMVHVKLRRTSRVHVLQPPHRLTPVPTKLSPITP